MLARMLIDEGLELLDDEACAGLLAEGHVGRVGITIAGLPVILPVNYEYIGGDVVFRTGPGSKLRAASNRAVIAFEVDGYDAGRHDGWSVLVIGRSAIVDDALELAELERLGLTPWADGLRDAYVRLRPEMVTGRRIVVES
jgi:nitroimidazol reductase NimA-like FMN-containing flavoprotein (pyridoxamine 5'-phosphate oxidase superfamily)